jgi:tripartite-type tricarboxylate transporter receptor subunit TctC
VRIVVPAGPGSAVDTVVRDLVPGLTELLGQQVVVDNKPGANSAIGAREVARAPADGHTLLHGNVNNALNDLLSPNPCCKLGEALLPDNGYVTQRWNLFNRPLKNVFKLFGSI